MNSSNEAHPDFHISAKGTETIPQTSLTSTDLILKFFDKTVQYDLETGNEVDMKFSGHLKGALTYRPNNEWKWHLGDGKVILRRSGDENFVVFPEVASPGIRHNTPGRILDACLVAEKNEFITLESDGSVRRWNLDALFPD